MGVPLPSSHKTGNFFLTFVFLDSQSVICDRIDIQGQNTLPTWTRSNRYAVRDGHLEPKRK